MGNCCVTSLNINSVYFAEFEQKLPDLTGKRIAITGTTSGTGEVAARTCLKKGAEVFLLNRESQRAQDSLRKLQQACPGRSVQHIPCDLMDFTSVREAARLLQTACGGRLDVLCNNAGIMAVPDAATKDGNCVQMQTNHTSHFLLTALMLPALRAAAEQNGEARIVNHSSEARKGKPLDARYLQKNGGKLGDVSTWERYHHSKLANILFTYELADRLANEKVKALVAAPGVAATNLFGANPCLTRMVSCVAACLAQSGEDGTMPLLTCIAGPEAKSGDFYLPEKRELSGLAKVRQRPAVEQVCQDKESQKLLWAESEKAVLEQFNI